MIREILDPLECDARSSGPDAHGHLATAIDIFQHDALARETRDTHPCAWNDVLGYDRHGYRFLYPVLLS